MTIEQIIAIPVLVLFTAGLGALLWFVLTAGKRLHKSWHAFATQVGTLRASMKSAHDPQIDGTYQGVAVNARTISRGSSDSKTIYTVVSAKGRSALPNNFGLEPQGMFFVLQKAFDAQDIELDDEEFDRAFVIKGADEGAVRVLLSPPEVRRALIASAQQESTLCVQGSQAIVEVTGRVTKPKRLHRMFTAATNAALALDVGAATPAAHHYVQTRSSQSWLAHRDPMRVFYAVMLLPFAFALWIGANIGISELFGRFFGSGLAAAALTAVIVFPIAMLIYPKKPKVTVEGATVTVTAGKRSHAFTLTHDTWWCGPWQMHGYFAGALLHLQRGEEQIAIGGAGYKLSDPRWQQAPVGTHADAVLTTQEFAALLNAIGYAIRHPVG